MTLAKCDSLPPAGEAGAVAADFVPELAAGAESAFFASQPTKTTSESMLKIPSSAVTGTVFFITINSSILLNGETKLEKSKH
jgi:hypothetical protein